MYFPGTESVGPNVMSSKVPSTYSTYQYQPEAEETLNLSAQYFTYKPSPPSPYLFACAILYFSCAVLALKFFFLLFPLAAFLSSFFPPHSTDLHCIAVSWQGSRGFEPRNWVFVQESSTLTQATHTVDCLPVAGEWISLPQLILWARQFLLIQIPNRSFRIQVQIVIQYSVFTKCDSDTLMG